MTKIVTQTRAQYDATSPAAVRTDRIVNGIIDAAVFVPAGQTHGEVYYAAANDRVIVDMHSNTFGVSMEEARAVVAAVNDSPRTAAHKKEFVVGVAAYLSHVLIRGADDAAHKRREAFRNTMVRNVQ